MTAADIATRRLSHQMLARPHFQSPGEVVHWMGAVQAQDYSGALWAVGLRMRPAVEQDIEQAIADRAFVRTWLMRGTLHFIAAEDLRWVLKLMEPRNRQLLRNQIRYQKLDLDEDTQSKGFRVLEQALLGNGPLPRPELAAVLEQAGIDTRGTRFMFLMQLAQAEGLVCQGPRRGKQYTFALLDEWLPPGRVLDRGEALAEFARRYFTSHGPATIQDFAWWSGLTIKEAQSGLEAVRSQLVGETVDGSTYWLPASPPPLDPRPAGTPAVYLLPAYDEFLVSYKDRSASVDISRLKNSSRQESILNPTVVSGGQVIGLWKRTLKKDRVLINLDLFEPLTGEQADGLEAAARRYGAYLGLPVTLT